MDEQQVEALTQPLDGLEREVDPYRQEQRGWKTIACAFVAMLLCGPLAHVHAADCRDFIHSERVQADSRAYRVAVANDLMQCFLPVYESLPHLSREQEFWLKIERIRIEGIHDSIVAFEQFGRFRMRTEFQIDHTKSAIGHILTLLKCITHEEILNEMPCWRYLSWQLMQEGDFDLLNALYVKGRLKVPPSATHIVKDEGYERFHYPLGQRIVQTMMAPYGKKTEDRQYLQQPDRLKHMWLVQDMERFLHQLRQPAIRQAQARLKAVGFDPGPIDGVMGKPTQRALQAYQNANGLLVTGKLDDATRNALRLK